MKIEMMWQVNDDLGGTIEKDVGMFPIMVKVSVYFVRLRSRSVCTLLRLRSHYSVYFDNVKVTLQCVLC